MLNRIANSTWLTTGVKTTCHGMYIDYTCLEHNIQYTCPWHRYKGVVCLHCSLLFGSMNWRRQDAGTTSRTFRNSFEWRRASDASRFQGIKRTHKHTQTMTHCTAQIATKFLWNIILDVFSSLIIIKKKRSRIYSTFYSHHESGAKWLIGFIKQCRSGKKTNIHKEKENIKISKNTIIHNLIKQLVMQLCIIPFQRLTSHRLEENSTITDLKDPFKILAAFP